MKDIINKIKKMINKDTLLYVCYYGSHLYGTNTKKSDIDFKGILLPTKESCLLYEKIRSCNFSTGNDIDKNSEEDIDIQLWSLQYWLELVKKGDTNALDLLYSISYKKQIIYKNKAMDIFFNNPLKLYNPVDINGYIGYAIGQAKKYGIRGSRLGIIKDVRENLKPIAGDFNTKFDKLDLYIDDIIKYSGDEQYCFEKEILNGDKLVRSVVICGKVYLGNIFVQEAYRRLDESYKQYGERSRQAEKNQGLDFKALSHAIRAILQMRQILTKGYIKYPFKGKDKELILKIKQGKMKWKNIENEISNRLDKIKDLQANTKTKGDFNYKFVSQNILNIYKKL